MALKTWTTKATATAPALHIKALKSDVERLTRAISDMLDVKRHKEEITGIHGSPETEHRYCVWIPYGYTGTIADPTRYAQDVELFFQAINQGEKYPITAEQIPGLVDKARAIFKAHRPIEDNRTTPEDHAQEIAERNERAAADRIEQEAAAAERERQQAATAAAAEYKHLVKLTDSGKSRHATAAANLKRDLEKNFPGVIFSVKSDSFSMGDSVHFSWTDGPTTEQADAIAGKYQQGHFDGMTDYYEYHRSAFIDIYGGSKYVSGNRTESDELINRAAAEIGLTITAAPVEITGRPSRNDYYDHLSGQFDRDTVQMIYRHARTLAGEITPPAAGPAITTATGATITHNQEKNGIEIKFPGKPDAATLDALKAASFRWSKFQKLWYAKETPRTIAAAERITGTAAPETTAQDAPGATNAGPDVSQAGTENSTPETDETLQDDSEQDTTDEDAPYRCNPDYCSAMTCNGCSIAEPETAAAMHAAPRSAPVQISLF